MKVCKSVIKRLKQKDEQAFDVVYQKYVNLVYHVIYKIVENKDDADDLTQDTLVQMVKSIDNFNERNNFKYWLLQIAKNKALDFLKKNKAYVDNNIVDLESNTKIPTTDFDFMMKQYENIITKEEFDIITLKLFYNLKFREIAELNDKTTSAVNNIYHRGIKKIKNKVNS